MKIVCVGDSVTYGQSVRAEQAWPAVLARLTGHDVRNEGVCGDTTRLALERFPKAVQLHSPDVVIVQFGHNDAHCWETDRGVPRVSAHAYAANLREMCDRARTVGATPVIIGPHHAPGRDDAYNARLRYYWILADMPGVYLTPTTVVDDGYGLHPDVLMHERYAIAVKACL